MTWTVVDDVNDQINVRATLHLPTQQGELTALIEALQKRLNKEKLNDSQLRLPDLDKA